MKRTCSLLGWLFSSAAIYFLSSSLVFAEEFDWSSATHQLLEADLNHDGYPDLLLQAKAAGQKHYLIPGQADAKKRYDYSMRIELPQRIASFNWYADQVQVLPYAVVGQVGHSLLVIPQSKEDVLFFDRVSSAADLTKASQTFEFKDNKWIKDSENPIYYTGDFDSDGRQDLLQLDIEKGEHQVILLEKNRKFKTAKKLSKTVQWGLKNNERLIIRDFNKDGQDDVFALSKDGKRPHVLLYSDGKGGFKKDDGKFIPVKQSHLTWSDNASGIAAVTRKSDNQTVLFRAYNQSEREKVADNCLGWVYDTETDTAKEYCPAANKGNAIDSSAFVGDVVLTDCPIEMSVGGDVTTFGSCDNGFVMPNTPTSAPQVSYGPHAPGAQINVVLANTQDYTTLTYSVWSLDTNGGYLHLGDVAAPTWYNQTPTVSLNVSLPAAGTYSLMYRACHANGCSGFGPGASVSIQQPVATHTVTTSASAGGSISPNIAIVPHNQTATFTVTPAVGYAISSVTGCGVTGSGNTYKTVPITAGCHVAAVFYRLTYTVNSATDGGGTISPTPSKVVFHGDTATFTVAPGYSKEVLDITGCNGERTGNSYTTGPITTACGVVATFKVRISSGTDRDGTITPAFIDVQYGKKATFTVTPNTGYTASVAGCNGTLSGTTYTTGPITTYCHAQATFTRKSYTVTSTASTGGTISPTPSKSVLHGDRATFTVTPKVGYAISSVSGCGVTGSGNTYTTEPITADCHVSAVFYRLSYTVSSATDGGGTISPTPTKVVLHGDTATFTVAPGYSKEVLNITGCKGERTGNSYTTGPITAACHVGATFKVRITSGTDGHGTITPAFVDVPYGQTATFTVTPETGYTAAVAGCNGTLSGTTYTTGTITTYCHAQATFTRKSYTVTSTASTGGTISPTPSKSVLHGDRATFTVTPKVGYAISSVSGCGVTGSGNTYTTEPITADCPVSAVFSRLSYTVSSATDGGGTISPTPTKVVLHGDTATFTVAPGYSKEVLDITGCNGERTGNSYTTGPITAACHVGATFKVRITSGTDGHGTITPAFVDVPYGQTATFTVTPETGYTAAVAGCNGTLSGTTYPTGAITTYCHAQATFTRRSYTVTSTASTGGTISPTPSKSVLHGDRATFTVTPEVGYAISSVSGCNGTLSGNTYTTGPVTADCQVSATFTASSYTVTATAGANGSITPPSRSVPHGQTTTFIVTPIEGYTAAATGCDGALVGNTYTTGPITGACTVSATFTANSYTVTATAGSNGSITPPSRSVPHGQTTTFTVTPIEGYTAAATGCDGALVGNTYTTGTITGECSVEATFTAIQTVEVPMITPNGGTHNGAVPVCLSSATLGTEIRYSIDGSNVTKTSPLYADCFPLESSATVKAKAFKSGMTDSAQSSAVFSITPLKGPITKYGYDARGRLIHIDDDKGVSATYALDTAGNRMVVQDQTAPPLSPEITMLTFSHKTVTEPTEVTITWKAKNTTACSLKLNRGNGESEIINGSSSGNIKAIIFSQTGVILTCVYRDQKKTSAQVIEGPRL